MCKIDICTFQISKAQLGPKTCSPEDYTGVILPLLLDVVPVWKKAIDKVSYKSKLVRVQRLLNIRIAKAYRTIWNKALCALARLTPST